MTSQPDAKLGTRETVFIVDDDAAICDGLCNLLESVGLAAEPYSSAEDFLSHWDARRAGCLVLDVQLPGMTGVEFQESSSRSHFRERNYLTRSSKPLHPTKCAAMNRVPSIPYNHE
jgi:DNA-binding NtrC family response regulator